MTPRNGAAVHAAGHRPGVAPADASFTSRVWARMFADRYDVQIERGITVAEGSPLAAHHRRLTSRREREYLAASLTCLLDEAGRPTRRPGMSMRVPVDVEAVARSSDVMADVVARLVGPSPVRARGVARLRILLGDGRGPVYRSGRGTLSATMRGVLAAF